MLARPGQSATCGFVLLWLASTLAGAQVAGPTAEEQLKQIDDAIATDNYADATRLAKNLEARGRRDTSPVAFILAKAFESRAASLRADYATVQAAGDRLAKNPADAAAKRTIGQFLCFQKGDWPKGLSLLRDCDDPKLAESAAWDLADPPDATRQVALGDRWWELASKEHGRERSPMTERAALWYSKAYAALEAGEKKRAGSRVAISVSSRLDRGGGMAPSPIELYHQLKFSELDSALGLRFGQVKPNLNTYFGLDAQIDNESSHGRIDNVNMVARALCVDADGKASVTEIKGNVPIDRRGLQTVHVGGPYETVIKHRNNDREVPRNVHVAFSIGHEVVYEMFLTMPPDDAWWLDPHLIERD